MRFPSPPVPRITAKPRLCRAGFSLIELLVVIGVIAIMIALYPPTFGDSSNSQDDCDKDDALAPA